MARGGQRTWEKAGGSGMWAGCEARSRLIFFGVEEAGVPPSSQLPHPMKGVGLPGTWALVGRNQHLSLWLEVEVGGWTVLTSSTRQGTVPSAYLYPAGKPLTVV